MGIREEAQQKGTVEAIKLSVGATFRTLNEREPYIVSSWTDDDDDYIPIAICLLTGKTSCLDHFSFIIPTDFIITEE